MSTSVDPQLDVYPAGTPQRKTIDRMSVVAPALAVITILLSLAIAASDCPNGKAVVFGLAAAWAILPPCWFLYDFLYLYKRVGKPETWETFKHGQQLAVALWAGLTASLGVLGASDFVKSTKTEMTCKLVIPNESVKPQGQIPVVLICAP